MQVILSATKSAVYREVAQATAYTGAKMAADPEAFGRISTIEADSAALDRFWTDACTRLCQALKRSIVQEGMVGQVYEVVLDVSASFDSALVGSMQASMTSYMVNSIVARWFGYTNRTDVADYALVADTMLCDLQRKTLYKRRPTRPVYSPPAQSPPAP